MNENSEFVGVDDRVKSSQKQKTNSTMSSPTVRYDGSKKSDIYSGDSGSNNNMNNCEICEKRDFANETELQSHKKLIHHVKLSLPGKVRYITLENFLFLVVHKKQSLLICYYTVYI